METLVQISTLHAMLTTTLAKDRGFTELVDNGYTADMKEMYSVVAVGDDICTFAVNTTEQDIKTHVCCVEVQMAIWMRGRLFNAEKVLAYAFKGVQGLWIVQNEDAEWNC